MVKLRAQSRATFRIIFVLDYYSGPPSWSEPTLVPTIEFGLIPYNKTGLLANESSHSEDEIRPGGAIGRATEPFRDFLG